MNLAADEWGYAEKLHVNDEKYQKYHETAVAAFKEGVTILESPTWQTKQEWRLDAEDAANGYKVYSKPGVQQKGKTFIATGEFEISADSLFHDTWTGMEDAPTWNPTILVYKKLLDVGNQSDITYTVFADALAGLVKSRDFVDVRCWRKLGNSYCIGSQSLVYEPMLPQKGCVRGEDAPAIFRITPVATKAGCCFLEMTLNTDLKGMLPRAIIDQVTHGTMMDYLKYLKNRVTALNQK